MVICSVVGCKSRNSLLNDVSFHRFPSDEALKQKWMIASGQPEDLKHAKNLRMCSKHFTADCFKQLAKGRSLKCGSIPTLNLNAASLTVFVDVPTNNNEHNLEHELDEDEDGVDNVNMLAMDVIEEENSDTECNSSDTDAAETNVQPKKATTLSGDVTLPLATRKLIFQLQRKAQVAESQKKTIARMKAQIYRLRKKNEELTATIAILENESLKEHRGPSILLVGM